MNKLKEQFPCRDKVWPIICVMAKALETLPEGKGNSYTHNNDSLLLGSTSEIRWMNLSIYAIDSVKISKLVHKFRNMRKIAEENRESSSIKDGARIVLALFEMRSRIMETDIIRDLD